MLLDRDLQFKNLYEENFRLIFLICSRYVRAGSDEAADLVQVVFTKAYENLHTLKDAGKVKSWLIAIAHNEGKTYLRKKARDRSLKERFREWVQNFGAGHEEHESHAQGAQRAVRNYIASLEDSTLKEIVGLFYYEEKKVKEIAVHLGMNVSTVTTKLNRFRNKMGKILTQEVLKEGLA